MLYRVRHETRYDYKEPVSISHHILRLTPHGTDHTHIDISPRPPALASHTDYFGNTVTSFNLLEPHSRMVVVATSEVEVTSPAERNLAASPAWEAVRDNVAFEACQYVFDSLRAGARPQFAEYALTSFTPRRPVLEAARELTRRIFEDFRFDSKASEVSTPVEVRR